MGASGAKVILSPNMNHEPFIDSHWFGMHSGKQMGHLMKRGMRIRGQTNPIFQIGQSVLHTILQTGYSMESPKLEAWYMNETDEDQRLPHHCDPPQYVSLEKLAEIGVLYWHLDADNYENDEMYHRIRKERGYTYTDMLTCCPEKLPNYAEKLKSFFEEHLHTDEEIRFCLDGSGYFDIRDRDDKWIRIWVKKGDMIVLPAGCYHRFTLDSSNYIQAMRLFVGEPVWTPYNRPQDEHPVRKEYVQVFFNKESAPAVKAH